MGVGGVFATIEMPVVDQVMVLQILKAATLLLALSQVRCKECRCRPAAPPRQSARAESDEGSVHGRMENNHAQIFPFAPNQTARQVAGCSCSGDADWPQTVCAARRRNAYFSLSLS